MLPARWRAGCLTWSSGLGAKGAGRVCAGAESNKGLACYRLEATHCECRVGLGVFGLLALLSREN
jgi:hypothetical protein